MILWCLQRVDQTTDTGPIGYKYNDHPKFFFYQNCVWFRCTTHLWNRSKWVSVNVIDSHLWFAYPSKDHLYPKWMINKDLKSAIKLFPSFPERLEYKLYTNPIHTVSISPHQSKHEMSSPVCIMIVSVLTFTWYQRPKYMYIYTKFKIITWSRIWPNPKTKTGRKFTKMLASFSYLHNHMDQCIDQI